MLQGRTDHDVTLLFKWLTPAECELARQPSGPAGSGQYAETLPHQPPPHPVVERLFRAALAREAATVARSVASVAAALLTLRRPPTLVSLARAGIPAGVLLKRYLDEVHGVEAPHYAVGMLRGLGLDANAVRTICARHPADSLVFVDGWVGKGATLRELRTSATALGVPSRLAALVDPAGLADFSGGPTDHLVPHALLDKTVCGLVGRPVWRFGITGRLDFLGAEYCATTGTSTFRVATWRRWRSTSHAPPPVAPRAPAQL